MGSTPPRPLAFRVVSSFFPYLWKFRYRVIIALLCMVLAKVSSIGVPLVLKEVIDALTPAIEPMTLALSVPLFLLVAFGALRFGNSLFTELRELVFARVTHRVTRVIVLDTFRNLLALSLRFHLSRKTGAIARDIEKGISGIKNIMSFTLYSVLPTLIELLIVIGYLLLNYSADFALIALVSLVLYVWFTIRVTSWRTHFRREMNEQDSRSNTRAIDALINYETVRYFGNQQYETERYDSELERLETVSVKSQKSLSVLNLGQSLIVAVSAGLIMWRAVEQALAGDIGIGDLVLINSFMFQLYIPLNFLGSLYRMLAQSLTDIERMFTLLDEQPDVVDPVQPKQVDLKRVAVTLDSISFGYNQNRTILRDVGFAIPQGKTVAVVGSSGSGKSTLARLIYRLYDCDKGSITMNGVDLRDMAQADVHAAIAIVPQDIVLFHDTIGYNIGYGKPGATQDEIVAIAKAARIHDFIMSTADGYDTQVGERGLKLSGGEKQRVAIARALLKNPAMLVFDEATSALDSANEVAIQTELRQLAAGKTLLVIAHRLSTIIDADMIIVLQQGQVVEQGSHQQLLLQKGLYSEMWNLQQEEIEP